MPGGGDIAGGMRRQRQREARILLEPSPASAGRARRWVHGELVDWSDEARDVAALLVSELVTNGVLHAGTDLAVHLRRDGTRARIEVVDGNPGKPVVKRYSTGAATGRGLLLVDELSDEWGVRLVGATKAVWVDVVDTAAASAETVLPDAPDLDAWPDLEEELELPATALPSAPLAGAPGAAAATVPAAELAEVQILQLPLEIYLEAQEHNDALMREFALIAETEAGPGVPSRLVELAGQVERQFGTSTASTRRQVDAALKAGALTVDLSFVVPRTALTMLGSLADLLDEADDYCTHGDLLTLASSPGLRHFRHWYREQVRHQLEGRAAEPWPAPPDT